MAVGVARDVSEASRGRQAMNLDSFEHFGVSSPHVELAADDVHVEIVATRHRSGEPAHDGLDTADDSLRRRRILCDEGDSHVVTPRCARPPLHAPALTSACS